MLLTATLIFYPLVSLYADVTYPDYSSFVNDYAGVLDSNWKGSIENICTAVEEQTGAEIAVAVVDNLQGITVEEYAVELFEKWGIGKADTDNGVLLLVSISDRKLRIEVGYGLEGAITDLEAGNIVDNVIVPRFKESNYGQGIYNGVSEIANQIYEEYNISSTLETAPVSKTAGFTNFLDSIFDLSSDRACFFCCIPIFLIGALVSGIKSLFRRKCPKCRKLKLQIKQTVIQAATYTAAGTMLEERNCTNCDYHDQKTVTIPKKTRSSSGGFIGGGFGGGGSSGGGFGGFGGGSSGGGGASGGW